MYIHLEPKIILKITIVYFIPCLVAYHLRALAVLLKDLGSNPSPTWQFTIVYSSNFRESEIPTQSCMEVEHQCK